MPIDLRQLRYFVTVAEEGHITRAAERLEMQQPPLSQQIRAMERELDVRLFQRKPRGVELTHAGQALFTEARAILSSLARALETTRRTARGEQGRLNVGIAPTAPFHPMVPRSIRAFREAFPLVSLTLEEGLSNEVSERLTSEQMDVAFVRTATLRSPLLATTPLLEEQIIVALPQRHPLTRGRRDTEVALKDLAGDAFILYGPPGTGIYDESVAACMEAGFKPHIAQLAPRITTTLGLVAAGLGVALVPDSMRSMTLNGVAYRRLKRTVRQKVVLGLASRRHDPSPVVAKFIACVRRVIKQS